MLIGVVVHPIDTLAHPSVPAGFRWAVHVGDEWSNLRTCLNAHFSTSRNQAALDGEAAAVCAVKVAKLLGRSAEMQTTHLEHDPIPVGGDLITVGGA